MGILTSALWGKQTEIEELINEHVQLVVKTLEQFKAGMFLWLEKEDLEKANELAFETHKLEGKADDIRRDVEVKLLEGALLARSRSEMLDLIERTDKLANAGEAAMDFTLLQRIKVPPPLHSYVKDIINISLEIVDDVRKAILALFQGKKEALDHTASIEHKEGEIDKLERDFIQDLFDLDLELSEKILLRQYCEALVEISDRAEDLSDQMEILFATRKT